jgi:hypothetical protein
MARTKNPRVHPGQRWGATVPFGVSQAQTSGPHTRQRARSRKQQTEVMTAGALANQRPGYARVRGRISSGNKRPPTEVPSESYPKKRRRLPHSTLRDVDDESSDENCSEEEETRSRNAQVIPDNKLKSKHMKALREMPIQDWFALGNRLTDTHHSLLATWQKKKIKLFNHKILDWAALKRASGGVNIKGYFDRFQGLTELLSEHSKYVEDWVRKFYATVYVDSQRSGIQFFFEGKVHRLSREMLAEYLGVGTYDNSCIHHKVYGKASPPRRPRIGGNNFPTAEVLENLFNEC